MDKVEKPDLEKSIQERLQSLPAPVWVREMIEHYRRTGTYRSQDLYRLLGDPTVGVEVGPHSSLPSYLTLRAAKAP